MLPTPNGRSSCDASWKTLRHYSWSWRYFLCRSFFSAIIFTRGWTFHPARKLRSIQNGLISTGVSFLDARFCSSAFLLLQRSLCGGCSCFISRAGTPASQSACATGGLFFFRCFCFLFLFDRLIGFCVCNIT